MIARHFRTTFCGAAPCRCCGQATIPNWQGPQPWCIRLWVSTAHRSCTPLNDIPLAWSSGSCRCLRRDRSMYSSVIPGETNKIWTCWNFHGGFQIFEFCISLSCTTFSWTLFGVGVTAFKIGIGSVWSDTLNLNDVEILMTVEILNLNFCVSDLKIIFVGLAVAR